MYYSDRPISSKSEDLLKRTNFSKLIADVLFNSQSQDTLTIGLFGKWGCGKTSLLNMAIQELEEMKSKEKNKENECPIVIYFEPWNFSDTNQLLSQFFIRLSQKFRSNDDKKRADIGDALQKYSNAFELANSIPFAGPALAYLGEKALSHFGTRLKDGWDDIDIMKQKEKVIDLLNEQSTKVVVVIDDIDRLSNEQIRNVFQLITSVAKFPNMIYLLAFDKKIVVKALEEVQQGSGEEYLEKIIQIPINIPTIQKSELRGILISHLDKIIRENPQIHFDTNHTQAIFNPCIDPFITSLRDVYRLCNSVLIKIASLADDVDFSDLIAITALEIHLPHVYQWVIENKNLLTGSMDIKIYSDTKQTEEALLSKYKQQIQNLLHSKENTAELENKVEIAITFLAHLFPYFGGKIGKSYTINDKYESLKNSYICHPDKFDRYFNLNLDYISLKRTSIRSAIFDMNSNELSDYLLELDSIGASYDFIEEIRALLPDIEPERFKVISRALMQSANQLETISTKSIFSLSSSSYARQLLNEIIAKIDDKDRYHFIINSLNLATLDSLPTLTSLVLDIERSYGRIDANGTMNKENQLISIDDLEKLEELYNHKTKSLLDGYNIFKYKNWNIVLYLINFFDPEYTSSYMSGLLTDNENKLRYVADSVSTWTGSSIEYEIRKEYEKHITSEQVLDAIKTMKNDRTLFLLPKDILNKVTAFYIYKSDSENHSTHIPQVEVDKQIQAWNPSIKTDVTD